MLLLLVISATKGRSLLSPAKKTPGGLSVHRNVVLSLVQGALPEASSGIDRKRGLFFAARQREGGTSWTADATAVPFPSGIGACSAKRNSHLGIKYSSLFVDDRNATLFAHIFGGLTSRDDTRILENNCYYAESDSANS